MSIQSSVFIATSLDGFIARADGSIDWLENANRAMPPGEDCGYRDFIATIDTLVMGRNTFELVVTFKPWPYVGTPVVVLSRHGIKIPKALVGAVSVTSETPSALVARLAAEGASRLYIDGGQTIQSFLNASLIDDLTITTIPILLGAGRPLFGALDHDVNLLRVSSKAYEFGFVQNCYRVVR